MLSIQNISFSYTKKSLFKNLSFTVAQGQNISIIDESGCGKSTLLKLIYGIYDLQEGTIYNDEKAILGPKFKLLPGEEYIKYLTQDFELMPFITVEENIGKFLPNRFRDHKIARIQELLEMVEMVEFRNVKAKLLSGGQKQRVALAQVLALEPEILLLDEPFSQIDNFKKNALRRNLFNYLKKKQISCIMATHESTDALSFSDEIIVLQNGEIIAQGNPVEIYSNPGNRYVAALFGDVNEIPFVDEEGTKQSILVYPHQFIVRETGLIKVSARQSYFCGSHYMIKAAYQGQAIFFNHSEAIERYAIVYLDII